MNTNIIEYQVKRISKNILILNSILLILSIIILICNFSEFKNIVIGPERVDIGEISGLKISGFAARNYVTVYPEKQVSTGLQYVEKEYDSSHNEKSKTVQSVYYVLKEGQNLILAALPPDKENESSYTGWVRKMTPEESDNLRDDISELKAMDNFTVSEYVLDVKKSSGAAFWYVVCIICMIINIIYISKSIRYFDFPEKNKIFKQVTKYENPDAAINSIQEELPYDLLQNKGGLFVLRSWILKEGFFSFNIYKLDDVVWIYKKVTRHSVNFIPTGKTYGLVLKFQDKSQCFITMGEKQVDYIITSLKQMNPWIVVGFSQSINKMWTSNYRQLVNYVQSEKTRIISYSNNNINNNYNGNNFNNYNNNMNNSSTNNNGSFYN